MKSLAREVSLAREALAAYFTGLLHWAAFCFVFAVRPAPSEKHDTIEPFLRLEVAKPKWESVK